ncbi:ATP-binding protein [Cryptosporangium phraense]|uniref:ATP-binding protein n=1 Tax=Cryptosporangium phraense TaxID=2593070 RepID=UPI00197ACAAE|nr:LuxR C-terminal-related transcriptional regulator [Cryptosporangium phraense]
MELTAREAEVLALLRDRLTNAEIAGQLYVSVRTVESHVSALLRKLGVADRRALARLAPVGVGSGAARPSLPQPLTPFVGRVRELSSLTAAVRANRLVTLTGPGGVGKTRLAVAAAQQVAGSYPAGATFVDLVRVVDPSMVVAAVADAVGVPERAGVNREQALLAALATHDGVLVVDNCEHVVDGVRSCVERLLTACPSVRVLATSRLRLMLPFETVFPVPGLSFDGDATELFTARMVAAGASSPVDGERATVAAVCRALDGMALAIELAAARVPAIGLDGLAGAHLPLLSSGHRSSEHRSSGQRSDHRHRSLRATIDWSYELLDEEERFALRAAAVFASRFDVSSLSVVMGRSRAETLGIVGRLVDWNLLTARPGPVTTYRMLETIRQYATSVAEAGEEGAWLRGRHLEWASSRLSSLFSSASSSASEEWCAAVDSVLDDARAALRWAESVPLAVLIADVSYQRGRPGEAQERYTQAAGWASDPAERRRLLRWAAGAAASRNVGADAVDLLLRAGLESSEGGAEDLALAVMYQYRCPGIIGRPVDVDEVEEQRARAHRVSAGEAQAELVGAGEARAEAARAQGAGAGEAHAELVGAGGARVAAALAMADGWAPGSAARSREHTDTAMRLAREVGDPVLQSMVYDQLIALEMAEADLGAALDAVRARSAAMDGLPIDALTGFEFFDGFHMASHLFLAVGDLPEARRCADAVTALPFYREERHIGLARRVEVDTLAGNFHTVAEYGDRIEHDWTRAGRPVASNLGVSAYCVAAAHGMRGDLAAQEHWTEITRALLGAYPRHLVQRVGWVPALDALVALHHGDPEAALARLEVAPDAVEGWSDPNMILWRTWYAASWAEASVLAGVPDAASRVARAAEVARLNPIASAVIERARALLEGDVSGFAELARRFAEASCPYQRDRTELLARG